MENKELAYIKNLKEKVIGFIRETSERDFDYYIMKGWFKLTDKKPIAGNGYVTENFRNGKEFGTIFARQIEMQFEEWLKQLENEK